MGLVLYLSYYLLIFTDLFPDNILIVQPSNFVYLLGYTLHNIKDISLASWTRAPFFTAHYVQWCVSILSVNLPILANRERHLIGKQVNFKGPLSLSISLPSRDIREHDTPEIDPWMSHVMESNKADSLTLHTPQISAPNYVIFLWLIFHFSQKLKYR